MIFIRLIKPRVALRKPLTIKIANILQTLGHNSYNDAATTN